MKRRSQFGQRLERRIPAWPLVLGQRSGRHGAGGVDGLFYGGGADSLVDQTLGVLVAVVYSGVLTAIIAAGIKFTLGLRINEDDEVGGIDLAEHGENAYDLHSGSFSSGGGTGVLAKSTAPTTPATTTSEEAKA